VTSRGDGGRQKGGKSSRVSAQSGLKPNAEKRKKVGSIGDRNYGKRRQKGPSLEKGQGERDHAANQKVVKAAPKVFYGKEHRKG